MRRSLLRAAFLLAATLLLFGAISQASAASGLELWNGAHYGMTEDEVRAAVPGVQRPAVQDQLGNGAKELLYLPSVIIAGDAYQAEFFFDADERLVQVSLTALEAKPYHLQKIRFDRLLTLLRKRYGQELSLQVQGGTLRQAEATFTEGDKNISLLALGIADNPAILSIIYQVFLAKEADKL